MVVCEVSDFDSKSLEVRKIIWRGIFQNIILVIELENLEGIRGQVGINDLGGKRFFKEKLLEL